MNVKIADLMSERVMAATPHQTVGHVKQVMTDNGISAMPVLDAEGDALGIVSMTDLVRSESNETPISKIMTEKVYTVPQYGDPSLAARIMRNHKIHRVLVTHEQKVVGVVSAFDLLRLVEDKRFVMKNAPSTSKRGGGGRKKSETG